MIDTQFELTASEQVRLYQLESAIDAGLRTFVDVGNALLEIRDGRLYRLSHGNFEDYCRERWGMSRIHAHRLIDAATVADNLLPIGNIPTTESQARPLTVLEPAQQREAWQRAIETAPNGKPTAAHVESVVRGFCSSPVDADDGDDTVTTERVAIVQYRLDNNDSGSTAQIAAWVGLSRQAAWEMLTKMSRVVPIVAIDGRWQRVPNKA